MDLQQRDLEALRRRLYRADATGDDLTRYLAASRAPVHGVGDAEDAGAADGERVVQSPLGAGDPDGAVAADGERVAATPLGPADPGGADRPIGSGPVKQRAAGGSTSRGGGAGRAANGRARCPGPAGSRRSMRRRVLLGVGAAALLLGAGAALSPALRPGPRPLPSPSASPSVVVLPTDVPDVVFADAGTVLTYRGEGTRTVPLDAAVAARSGAMTVVVAPARRARIGWQVLRVQPGTAADREVLAGHDGVTAATGGDPQPLAWTDGAPDEVAVSAAEGLRWTLVVTVLRGRTPS